MRVTLEIDDELAAAAEAGARRRGMSMPAVCTDVVRTALLRGRPVDITPSGPIRPVFTPDEVALLEYLAGRGPRPVGMPEPDGQSPKAPVSSARGHLPPGFSYDRMADLLEFLESDAC